MLCFYSVPSELALRPVLTQSQLHVSRRQVERGLAAGNAARRQADAKRT